MLFFWRFLFLEGKRTRDFAFVSLCHGRSGEEMCTRYARAASGQMQYDYKQTKYIPFGVGFLAAWFNRDRRYCTLVR